LHCRRRRSPKRRPAQPATVSLSDEEIERFLREAKVVRTRSAGKGVTNSDRATLTDGTITHDAHIQLIDESRREFRSSQGIEFNFRDSWMFNVATYRLDRLLGLGMVPVSIERRWRSVPAAFTWWVDDVLMDEGERMKSNTQPPQPFLWNQQMQMVRLLDQLIYNIDRNMGNLLIAKGWRVWAIDHTRAYRTATTLKTPKNVTGCDRHVFERLKQLDKATLKKTMGRYLQDWEIETMLKRRDAIVEHLNGLGPGALFDRQVRRNDTTMACSGEPRGDRGGQRLRADRASVQPSGTGATCARPHRRRSRFPTFVPACRSHGTSGACRTSPLIPPTICFSRKATSPHRIACGRWRCGEGRRKGGWRRLWALKPWRATGWRGS
jgi:hypothetical protein